MEFRGTLGDVLEGLTAAVDVLEIHLVASYGPLCLHTDTALEVTQSDRRN